MDCPEKVEQWYSISNTTSYKAVTIKGKHRSYLMTLNNPTEEEENNLKNWKEPAYLVYQLEKIHTLHIQAFFVFKNERYIGPIKKLFKRCHLEVCRSDIACEYYCKKKESRIRGPYEFGEKPKGSGKRTDIDDAVNDIKLFSTEEWFERHGSLYVKYRNGFKDLLNNKYKHRTSAPTSTYIEGKCEYWEILEGITGSYFVYDGSWDGYTQQDTVLILNKKNINFSLLESPLQLNLKISYGSIPFNSKHIIIYNYKHLQRLIFK